MTAKYRVEIDKEKIKTKEYDTPYFPEKVAGWAKDEGLSIKLVTEQSYSKIDTDSLGSHRYIVTTKFYVDLYSEEDATHCKLVWG